MTTSLRVQFDGKVLVPQGPVDLPTDQVLEIEVLGAPPPTSGLPGGAILRNWIASQPAVDRGEMPTDGAAQHDHYLYGHAKRS